jgi:hypothetical protein
LHARQRSRGAINVATLMAGMASASVSPKQSVGVRTLSGAGGASDATSGSVTPPDAAGDVGANVGGVDHSLLSAIRVQQEQFMRAVSTPMRRLAEETAAEDAAQVAAAAAVAATADAPAAGHSQPQTQVQQVDREQEEEVKQDEPHA